MKFVFQWAFFLVSLIIYSAAHAALSVSDPLDRIVAVVNDDIITALELDSEVTDIKKQLLRQNTRLPSEDVLKKQILERMILQRLQLQTAERVHIRVDDEMLNRAINNIAAQNNLSLGGLRETLDREGVDFGRFRENIRKEIIINQLQQRQVFNRITITKQEIDNFLTNQSLKGAVKGEYNIAHIHIALPEGATPEQIEKTRKEAENIVEQLRNGADFAQTAIAVSDGQKALEGGNLGWRNFEALPTLFSDWLRNQQIDSISHPLRSPSGFHIIKLLGKRINEEQYLVDQTHVRHILIKTTELTSSNEARNRLLKIRERIINGEDFAKLAKLHSEDPGSSDKGGDLGWVNPGTMVPPFEKAYKELAVNQISQPVRTNYGWHIIEVLGTRAHDNTETVKRNKAMESIRARKTEPALQNWFRGLRDGSFIDIRL